MPRPKSPTKKRHAVQVLFSDEEHESFERLMAARSEELRGEGVLITAPMLIRWLINREVIARGLDKPASGKALNARKATKTR